MAICRNQCCTERTLSESRLRRAQFPPFLARAEKESERETEVERDEACGKPVGSPKRHLVPGLAN